MYEQPVYQTANLSPSHHQDPVNPTLYTSLEAFDRLVAVVRPSSLLSPSRSKSVPRNGLTRILLAFLPPLTRRPLAELPLLFSTSTSPSIVLPSASCRRRTLWKQLWMCDPHVLCNMAAIDLCHGGRSAGMQRALLPVLDLARSHHVTSTVGLWWSWAHGEKIPTIRHSLPYLRVRCVGKMIRGRR